VPDTEHAEPAVTVAPAALPVSWSELPTVALPSTFKLPVRVAPST